MKLSLSTIEQVELQQFCTLAGLGELTPEMVRMHAPDALLTLRDGERMVARSSLWWRRVPLHTDQRLGLIGHYAAVDDHAAAQILSTACSEFARHGCTLAVGPMDGNTWRRYRLLSERGSEPPFFLEPDNPDEWPRHFEAQGFTPLAHYYSSMNEDIHRPWPKAEEAASGFTLRRFDPSRGDEELHTLWQVATHAFANNFLYTPLEAHEFLALYRPLLPLLRPELVLIAERDTQPAAFCFAIPDLLQGKRGEAIDTVIIKSIAVLPEYQGQGLGTLLIARVNAAAAKLGMRRSIHALMHESNPSRHIGHGFMRDFRRYTLYARPL